MIVVYDFDNRKILYLIIDDKKYIIKGKCNRCGICCGDCEHLIRETLDNKNWCSCKLEYNKPIICALTIPDIEECGLKKVLING